jgi:hypothetical protein
MLLDEGMLKALEARIEVMKEAPEEDEPSEPEPEQPEQE